MSGEILGRNRQHPSVFKSNPLHVVIFQYFLIEVEECFIYTSKMIGNYPEVLNFNRSFLKTQPVPP